MISRTFTIHEPNSVVRCYKHFDQSFENATVIAVVLQDGERDFYALDDTPDALPELERFLKDEGMQFRVLGLFRRCNGSQMQ